MRALTWSALGIPLHILFSRFYITNAFTGSGIHRFFPSIAGCSIVTNAGSGMRYDGGNMTPSLNILLLHWRAIKSNSTH